MDGKALTFKCWWNGGSFNKIIFERKVKNTKLIRHCSKPVECLAEKSKLPSRIKGELCNWAGFGWLCQENSELVDECPKAVATLGGLKRG